MTNPPSPKQHKPHMKRSVVLTPYGRWVAARQALLRKIAGRSGWDVNDTMHPMQPVEIDKKGVMRFKKNAIVEFLLEHGPFDMNDLACMNFSDDDRVQFAQLIGYSVSGFANLSYAQRSCPIVYEDELPPMSDEDYSEWFATSFVDGVRMGPLRDTTATPNQDVAVCVARSRLRQGGRT